MVKDFAIYFLHLEDRFEILKTYNAINKIFILTADSAAM